MPPVSVGACADKMAKPDPKVLKQLAAQCRKLGILSFKGFGYEFTLAPTASNEPTTAKSKAPTYDPVTKAIVASSVAVDPVSKDDWDSLTEEQKLFWSTGTEAEREQAT